MKVPQLFAVIVLCSASTIHAYDQDEVHPRMTGHAFQRVNSSIRFLSRLGFPDGLIDGVSIERLVRNGSIAEDDSTRPLKHFYEPISEAPLTILRAGECVVIVEAPFTARQWATVTPENEFGLAAAKQQLYDALTIPVAQERSRSAAELFYTLGHLMHLVQDMAQPQHTRNDMHPTSDGKWYLKPLDRLRRQSRYEAWCEVNLKSDAAYLGYSTVSLPSYGAYFKTGDGKGLAEYSNANFVTESTNHFDTRCPRFDFRSPAIADTTRRTEQHIVTVTTFGEDGSKHVESAAYEDQVLEYLTQDVYAGSFALDRNHTFLSYFDYELEKVQQERVYSLPAAALASKAELLVPRAVGYSAGFLQHFFRGNIDAKWKKNTDGTWNLTISNLGQDPIGADAQIEAYFRATPKYLGAQFGDLGLIVRGPIKDLTSFSGLDPGTSVVIENIGVDQLKDGDDLTHFERRIVIRGNLGGEPQAVIPLVQPGSVPIDELTLVVSWTNIFPVLFVAREKLLFFGSFLAQFESVRGDMFNRWPESSLRFLPPVEAPEPLPPTSPSPIVFHTTRVPMSKTFNLIARASRSVFYWLQSNLQVQVYVDDELVRTLDCPPSPQAPLVDECFYDFRCRDGTCIFDPLP